MAEQRQNSSGIPLQLCAVGRTFGRSVLALILASVDVHFFSPVFIRLLAIGSGSGWARSQSKDRSNPPNCHWGDNSTLTRQPKALAFER